MLSTANLLSPSNGEPIVAPTLDMVLGCYYLTHRADGPGRQGVADCGEGCAPGTRASSARSKKAKLASTSHGRTARAHRVRISGRHRPGRGRAEYDAKTELSRRPSAGSSSTRCSRKASLFQDQCHGPPEPARGGGDCYRSTGSEETGEVGTALRRSDSTTRPAPASPSPSTKSRCRQEQEGTARSADAKVEELREQYHCGLITEEERYQGTVDVWAETTNQVEKATWKA